MGVVGAHRRARLFGKKIVLNYENILCMADIGHVNTSPMDWGKALFEIEIDLSFHVRPTFRVRSVTPTLLGGFFPY